MYRKIEDFTVHFTDKYSYYSSFFWKIQKALNDSNCDKDKYYAWQIHDNNVNCEDVVYVCERTKELLELMYDIKIELFQHEVDSLIYTFSPKKYSFFKEHQWIKLKTSDAMLSLLQYERPRNNGYCSMSIELDTFYHVIRICFWK